MIRQLRLNEIIIASSIADIIYPFELAESLESFENKFSFYPKGFLGLFNNQDLTGYILGHPWKGNNIVPIDYKGPFFKDNDCFYIHDGAILPDYRGEGYGRKLLESILNVGVQDGFKRFMLVAVNEKSKKICEKQGFVSVENLLYGKEIKSYKMEKRI